MTKKSLLLNKTVRCIRHSPRLRHVNEGEVGVVVQVNGDWIAVRFKHSPYDRILVRADDEEWFKKHFSVVEASAA